MNIFWTDETWVTGEEHNRVWVTHKVSILNLKSYKFHINILIKKGETLNTSCVADKIKKTGSIFRGSFLETKKGSCLFREKDWGSVSSTSDCQSKVPLIHGMISMRPGIFFMQDNISSHAATVTREEISNRAISTIEWPPCSPDYNPIEHI